jgi:hypothetical protein
MARNSDSMVCVVELTKIYPGSNGCEKRGRGGEKIERGKNDGNFVLHKAEKIKKIF